MTDAIFKLNNPHCALSPMVFQVYTTPNAMLMITIRKSALSHDNGSIDVALSSDVDGNIAFDIAPIVRDLIMEQFIPGNWDNTTVKGSPFGANIIVSLGIDYENIPVMWANRDIGITLSSYGNFLVPSGICRYYPGLPFSVDVFNSTQSLLSVITVKRAGTIVYHVQIRPKMGIQSIDLSGFFNASTVAGNYLVTWNGNHIEVHVEKPYMQALANRQMVYVRYCNAWAGTSYAMLQVTFNSQANKSEYIAKTFLDMDEDVSTPDRIMIGNTITRTFMAGKDQLSRPELEELQAILSSPMVGRYDVKTEVWVPVYPKDGTIKISNEPLQEITIEFEENREGF